MTSDSMLKVSPVGDMLVMRCCAGVGGSTAYSVNTGAAENVTPVSL